MLLDEAVWFGGQIGKIESNRLSPMLNLGSSTEAYRKRFQPWIDQYILYPLMQREVRITHQDIKALPGVDLVGDLGDPDFVRQLSKQTYRGVLCFNLLEHLENRNQIADLIVRILCEGGYLFVSCPYRFPYHPDPIDTRFRPDPRELGLLFPGTETIAAGIVGGRTYLELASLNQNRWLTLCRILARLCIPFFRPRIWLLRARHLPWLFTNLKATCLVMRKRVSEGAPAGPKP